MKELLEAGVHFGHQTRRWNPKMKKYIFGSRNGIYIIDLQKTLKLFKEVAEFVTKEASKGKTVLFVGTKRQAQDAIASVAEHGIPYVNHRWLGGTLTNFATIKKSVKKLHELEELLNSEEITNYPKKEVSVLTKKKERLEKMFSGIKNMDNLPDLLFVIDPKREKNAVHEARIMGIPVISVVDTNCNPDVIDYVIPGNDDAIRAINLFVNKIVAAINEGRDMVAGDSEQQQEEVKPEKKAKAKAEEVKEEQAQEEK
jgi:small subunit ribosomal protein S2